MAGRPKPSGHSGFPFRISSASFTMVREQRGLTLIELLLGGMTLAITAAAILGAYLGQVTLNEHARNLALGVHDANRVIEDIRQENSPCTAIINPNRPEVVATNEQAATNFASWDAWLKSTAAGAGGGKSLAGPDAEELIVVTCQDADGGTLATDFCGTTNPAQVGTGEWQTQAAATTFDPLRVTVSVCWRHRERTIGECGWNGAALIPDDTLNVAGDTASVIDSPAMLTTLVTCRQ